METPVLVTVTVFAYLTVDTVVLLIKDASDANDKVDLPFAFSPFSSKNSKSSKFIFHHASANVASSRIRLVMKYETTAMITIKTSKIERIVFMIGNPSSGKQWRASFVKPQYGMSTGALSRPGH